MKKNKFYKLFLLALLFLIKPTVYASQSIDNSADIDDIINGDPIQPPACPTECPGVQDVLNLITPASNPDQTPPLINVPAILQEDLYKSTTGFINRRYLLDEPSLFFNYFNHCGWTFTATAFYNFTPKAFFTKCSPFISSYIDLTNQNIINEINSTLDTLGCANVDIPGVLGLFSNIKLQQHRVGFILGLSKNWERLSFSFGIPFYYLVEHFFLSDCEIKAIENNRFLPTGANPSDVSPTPAFDFDLSTRQKTEEFVRRHIVSDRFGFGDARFDLEFKAFDGCNAHLWLGLTSVWPTAVAFRRGILGGEFSSHPCQPEFNIKRIFDLYFCSTIQPTPELVKIAQRSSNKILQDELTSFLVGALDRLSTVLINAPLGNGGFFGIGPKLDFIYEFNNCWSAHTYAYFRGFNKRRITKFFLEKKDPAEFNRDYRNPDLADQNLAFLNTQLINTFYPLAICVDVRPGLVIRAGQLFRYYNGCWKATFGVDYWTQRAEKLFLQTINKNLRNNLNLAKNCPFSAEQVKLFGSFGYQGVLCKGADWHFTVLADASVFNRGIGKNYTLAFRFGIDF